MAETASTSSNKVTIAAGVVTVLLGSIPLLTMLGILPRGNAPTDPAPSWMGWLIGAMFVGAGFIVIMRGVLKVGDQSGDLPATAPRALRLLNGAIGFGIVCGLAMLFSWVAFGPGPRHFSVSAGGLSMLTSGSGDTLGRVAFGFGAILIWCFITAVAVKTLHKWRQ